MPRCVHHLRAVGEHVLAALVVEDAEELVDLGDLDGVRCGACAIVRELGTRGVLSGVCGEHTRRSLPGTPCDNRQTNISNNVNPGVNMPV